MEIGGLGLAIDIGAGNLIGIDCGGEHFSVEDIVAADGHESGLAVYFVHEVLDDGKLFFGGQLAVLIHSYI